MIRGCPGIGSQNNADLLAEDASPVLVVSLTANARRIPSKNLDLSESECLHLPPKHSKWTGRSS
jgi:hypothetical protein